jgi:hypothetical protein
LFLACMKNAYFSTTTSAWGVVSNYGATIPIYGAILDNGGVLTCRCGLWSLWIYEGSAIEFATYK